MNVTEILKGWLSEHGYDGLCGDECGCGIDDLFPCEMGALCIPAYKRVCPTDIAARACGESYADVIYTSMKPGMNSCAGCPMAEEAR